MTHETPLRIVWIHSPSRCSPELAQTQLALAEFELAVGSRVVAAEFIRCAKSAFKEMEAYGWFALSEAIELDLT